MFVQDGRCVDKNGTLCGSIILMNEGVKNCINSCNISLEQTLKMATRNPARVMNLEYLMGNIRAGLDAKFIIAMNVKDF